MFRPVSVAASRQTRAILYATTLSEYMAALLSGGYTMLPLLMLIIATLVTES